ncbi:MAG: acyl-CoA dehydrogenase [Rhodospirillaceae bacterium]|nr:acyl-CoA dehydrogenase [Rhodospirillaceae bacterium]MBT6118558.1 acyl-CoA dehydrogenase [Rhodospirillaceae bacterium]
MRLTDERELRFVLYELLDAEALCARPRFAEHGRETFDAALETARQIAGDLFAPCNRAADEDEPRIENGRVVTLPDYQAALDAFFEAGFGAAHVDAGLGGMQMPWTVAQACFSQFLMANVAAASYPMLTIGAANMLAAFGTEAQKTTHLEAMYAGRTYGTMALTEPQAGSSLADIRTKAEPTGEGDYRIAGTKIFISGGEHELSENIVHMVLARLLDAPPGVKGISMFLVPRYRPDGEGWPTVDNDVRLGGLIHKMGWRGTVSTMLNFGEGGDCRGTLVGEANRGLGHMFHMMNEARIGVAMCATMLGAAGYNASLDYALERPQGRPAGAKDPASAPVPIIAHADVRRMLLAQKSYVEGAFALGLTCARLVDEQATAEDEAARREAHLLLEILTPVMKAWSSDWCLEANRLAIQIHGGYGYTREYPVEQHYRDNRLNPIHEGTNGIQAIDLLGRKAVMQDGAALALLRREIMATVEAGRESSGQAGHAEALAEALDRLDRVTATLAAHMAEDAEAGLANASVYLAMAGHTVIAWIWLRQALAAERGLAAGQGGEARDFYEGKLAACRYFFRWELPTTATQAALLESRDDTCLAVRPEQL